MIFLFSAFSGAMIGALILFLIASLTDYWDGRIARARGEITAFGKLMDPIADKVLTISAFIGFVQLDIVPAWMVVAIIMRDFLITGARLAMGPASDKLPARRSGKNKTVAQFVAIVAILVYLAARQAGIMPSDYEPLCHLLIWWGMLGVMILTLGSGIWYLWTCRDVLLGKR